MLATRLKELEQAGIVVRRVQPRPSGAVVYELTEYGADLEEIVHGLGRWGARSLGERRTGEIATACSMIVALRSTFRPDRAKGLRAGYELHLGDVVIHARIANRRLTVAEGPLPEAEADLVIRTKSPLRPLLAGELTADQAVADGTVQIQGDPALLTRFADLFPVGPTPPSPPP